MTFEIDEHWVVTKTHLANWIAIAPYHFKMPEYEISDLKVNEAYEPFKTTDKGYDLNDFVDTPIDEDGFPVELEDGYMLGILITVLYNNGSAAREVQSAWAKVSTTSAGRNGKQQKTDNKDYARLFRFIDIKSKRIYSVTELNGLHQEVLWGRFGGKQKATIGDVLAIKEPSLKSIMAGNVPIMDVRSHMKLLEYTDFENYVPRFGEDRMQSFSVTGITGNQIRLSRAGMVQAICSGKLCDRQMDYVRDGSNSCGCYHYNRAASAVVLQFFLSLVHPNVREAMRMIRFRSWKTTNLLFRGGLNGCFSIQELQSPEATELIRTTLQLIKDYVGANGGWTIIGWYKRGSKTDASASAATENKARANMGSDNVNYHVVYLYPTIPEIVETDGFRALQITRDQLVAASS